MKKPIIAAQLYTVRELLTDKSEEEIREVLTTIKTIGYEAIQISGVGEVTPEKAEIYRKIADELELDICASHFSIEYMEENTEWLIDIHKIWQCSYAGVGSMPEAYRNSENIDVFIGKMNKLGEKLKAAGIQLIYHNHKFEFEKVNGKPMLQYMFEQFNPAFVQMEIDTYWIQAGGANPVTWINQVAGNMGVMHLKDFRIVKDEQQFAEIGQGNLEWVEILEAANQAGVTYAAVEQDSFTEVPIESLKMSFDYLKSL